MPLYYLSTFTAASHGSLCDSRAFLFYHRASGQHDGGGCSTELLLVINSSIFIVSFSSFVVGFRPSHRSRDTHDGTGSAPCDTRSRPAVINARRGQARPSSPRSRSSSRRNWIKVVRPNEFIAVSSAGEYLQPTVALLIYLPHPSRITLLQWQPQQPLNLLNDEN